MSRDPYAALGLRRGASAEEVKKAYRKLAKELHPDVRPNDPASEERFKQASAAFNLLSDEDRKAKYDRGEIDADGQEVFRQGGFGGGGGPGGFGGAAGRPAGDGFEDLFEGLFGSRRRSGPQKGQDIRYAVEIDFLDAVNGARRRLSMSDGKTLDVAIPAGVKSGQTLRLKSQGQPGQRGAPPGDAYLEITVGESAAYSRDGHDIRMTVNVSLTEAVAGGKVDVPAPQGPVTVKIPPGSNTGTTLRLKGKGVQVKDAPGNLYVTLAVVLPKKPDEALKRFVGDWSGDETPSRM